MITVSPIKILTAKLTNKINYILILLFHTENFFTMKRPHGGMQSQQKLCTAECPHGETYYFKMTDNEMSRCQIRYALNPFTSIPVVNIFKLDNIGTSCNSELFLAQSYRSIDRVSQNNASLQCKQAVNCSRTIDTRPL